MLGERYQLLERRAAGANATVWTANDEFLRRRVAVKVLHEHLAADADLVARFAAEARAAANVNHPALVAVYDTIAEPPSIVLEWVDGPDLRQRLDSGPIPADEAIALGVALCNGLSALHDKGLVHRDVKPANVLLARDGTAKLTDFGITTANAGDRTATGVVLGTAKYLAPEQVRGAELDGRTDLFALAIVLYEALAGSPPWEREGYLPTALARLDNDAVALDHHRGDLPAGLAATIMKGLAREPADRWPTAEAFAEALIDSAAVSWVAPRPRATTPVGGDTTVTIVTAPPEPGPDPAPATRSVRPRRRRWPRIGGSAVLAAIALLGWTLVAGSRQDAPAPGPEALQILAAIAFDPEGTGPTGEHNDLAARAIDGDPSTGWPTERYDSRDLGPKSGVGLILVLAAVTDVHEVRVETGADHWAADVRVTTMTTNALDDADQAVAFGPVVGGGAGLAPTASIPVGGRGNVVLVWITDLGLGDAPIRLVVNEVTVA